MTMPEEVLDCTAQSVIEGRTTQWHIYRRMVKGGARERLHALLREKYNPLKEERA